MKLSALSIRWPRVLAVLVLTSVVWGSVALVILPRQEEPVLTWRLANVVTRLPGASPERVESLITDVLERSVEEVDEVEHIYSVSRAGVSLVQVELSDDVTVAEPVWQKVRHKLAQAAGELPREVIGPDLDDEIMGTFSQLIAVTGDRATYRELKDHAQRLERQLRYLPMAASTTLFGVQHEVVRVEMDPLKLAAYDLSIPQVAAVLRNRNVRQPSGRLRVGEKELLVETSGEFETDEQLQKMVLMVTPGGRTVHLGDVGRIVRTTRDPPEPLARVNGKRAVVVGVRARGALRIDHFGDQVGRVVEQFRLGLPDDVGCDTFHSLSRYTRERADYLWSTLLLSVMFVFLSTALFMGWRGATVVTATIPLTGLIVLILFSVVGMPLNQMSVMAIIMAFGLLVDDAIVITEQIHRRVSQGVDVRHAAAEEPDRLFIPLVVTTLTTVAAFLPIFLLPGGVGEFVRAIPVGLAICLLTALLVSTTVIPWLCVLLMKGVKQGARPPKGGPAFAAGALQSAKNIYRAILAKAVARPALTLVPVVVVMASLASVGLTLRRDFFSPVQRDQFIIDVFASHGSALGHTSEVVERIEAMLAEEEEIVSTGSFIGRNAPLVFYNLESQETYANHFAQLVVRVSDWRLTARIAERLQAELRTRISDAECCVHILEHGAPFVAPFEIRISGPSVTTLRELGRRAAEQLKQDPDVRNARTNYGGDVLKLVARVNEPVARQLGIDQSTVADELRHRLDGLPAGHLREGDERIEISVRLPASAREDIRDLSSARFKPRADAKFIPFSSLAAIVPEWEAPSIYRRDGERTLCVLAYPRFGLTPAQVSKQFPPWLAALRKNLPSGYRIELGGENQQRNEAESHLLGNAVYAVFPILLLLVVEFQSLRLALMLLVVIPLSAGGAMLGLFLTGWPLNFMALMGMMMLMGVVVNDALILVDGFERRRQAGEPIPDLVVAGTLERTRHVVITSVTTIAGFLPLAISASLLWPPLAIAIIGGLSLATLVTLVGIPAAYALLHRSSHFRPGQ